VEGTRRLHAAKRLLDETDLPLTRVALAAGYGSVRRFNDAFRGAYGRPPGELRARRRVSGARGGKARLPGAPGEYTFRLAYRPPYDAAGLLAFLAGRAVPGVERATGGTYARTIRLDGHAGALSVTPAPSGDALLARIRLSEPSLLARAVERVRRLFDLDAEPAAIAGHLSADPLLAPLVSRYPGTRVPGCWDPFELAVRAVLGQQVSVKGARTLAGRLAARFGERLPGDEPNLLFPLPEALADAALEGLGLTGARQRTLRALAGAVTRGALSFQAPADELAARLVEIPGIGAWTAEYVAMRGLSEPDAFPSTDLVLKRAAAGARSDAWRPWRAYAAMLLWRSAS